MAADYTFHFDVASPPAVTTTSPTDSATGVHLNATITVNFSKQVNATTSSFKLECPTGTPESYGLSASPASSFTLTPSSNLPSDTQCTVTVVANQVTSTDFGLNMDSDYVFSFHTVSAPTVTSTVPANNATGVATNATITVNFDRSVDATTSSFTVECPTGTPESYSLSSSPASSYTLTPNSPLPGGVTCTVTVVASQVTDDSNGTPMASNYVFSFRRTCRRPSRAPTPDERRDRRQRELGDHGQLQRARPRDRKLVHARVPDRHARGVQPVELPGEHVHADADLEPARRHDLHRHRARKPGL